MGSEVKRFLQLFTRLQRKADIEVYRFIRNYINGVAFGVTETVPGVSGGTIAVMLGFYDEIVGSVNNFGKNKRESLGFLVPLALGAVTGVLLFGSFVYYLLANHSFPTMLFFVGLVAGLMPPIYLKLKAIRPKFSPKRLLLVALPALALALFSSLKETAAAEPEKLVADMGAPYMLFLFFAGILAAAALVIPGVSGSAVLVMTGVYPLATYSLSRIGVFLADMTNMALLLDICKVCFPLGLGILIGGLAMLRLIGKLLKTHYETVYSVILGLLAGSVYALLGDPIVFRSYAESRVPTPALAIGIATFALGAAIAFFSGKTAFGNKLANQ